MTEERTPPQTRREFEQALRGLGFSSRQAKRICAEGFQGGRDEPPDEIALQNLLSAIFGASILGEPTALATSAGRELEDPDLASVRDERQADQNPAEVRDGHSPENKEDSPHKGEL